MSTHLAKVKASNLISASVPLESFLGQFWLCPTRCMAVVSLWPQIENVTPGSLLAAHPSVPAQWVPATGRALCICSGPVTRVNGVPPQIWFCFRIKVTLHSSLPRTPVLHICCPSVSIRSNAFTLRVSSGVTSDISRERPDSYWVLLYTQRSHC